MFNLASLQLTDVIIDVKLIQSNDSSQSQQAQTGQLTIQKFNQIYVTCAKRGKTRQGERGFAFPNFILF